MQREDFIAMVNSTTFDEEIKKLFITSYETGFREGQIYQLQRAINVLDGVQFEMEKK